MSRGQYLKAFQDSTLIPETFHKVVEEDHVDRRKVERDQLPEANSS